MDIKEAQLLKGISKNYYFFMTSPLIPLLYERKRIVFRYALVIKRDTTLEFLSPVLSLLFPGSTMYY